MTTEEKATGITKALWLRMLTEGGYSTAAELTSAVSWKKEQVESILWVMENRGYCSKFRNPDRKNGVGYGVTPGCKVPKQVLLQDILAATSTQE